MYFQSPQDTGDLYQGYYYFFDDVSPQIDPLRKLLMRHLPVALTYSAAEHHLRQQEYNVDCPPQIVSPFLDRLVRFLVVLRDFVKWNVRFRLNLWLGYRRVISCPSLRPSA